MRWQTIEPSTKIILKIILAVVAVAFLWVIRDIIILVLLAIVLASAMEPLVAYFQLKRVPRAVSVLGVYVLVLGVVGVVIALVVPVVAQQARLLAQNLPEYTAQLQTRFPTISLLLGNSNLPEVVRHIFSEATGDSSVVNKTVGVFNGFFSVFTVLVISFYLVAEQKGMINFIRSLVPQPHQDFTMNLVRKIQNKMGLWVIGQIILSLSIFLLTFIGLSLLGVKYALFLALLAGVLEIIPYIGPFVSAVPAIFFALIQSPALAVAVAALYILVQKTEGYFLVPKIMEKTVGTSPLLVLVSLLVGYKLAGIWGLLLAVPIVGAITVVVNELSSNHTGSIHQPVSDLIVEKPSV